MLAFMPRFGIIEKKPRGAIISKKEKNNPNGC
jgi:hypothetical protein